MLIKNKIYNIVNKRPFNKPLFFSLKPKIKPNKKKSIIDIQIIMMSLVLLLIKEKDNNKEMINEDIKPNIKMINVVILKLINLFFIYLFLN